VGTASIIATFFCNAVVIAAPQDPSTVLLVSAYELDECAAAFADSLRLSDLANGEAASVRLALPEWSNPGDAEVGPSEVLVRELCDRVNQYSGAVISFETGYATGDGTSGDGEESIHPTVLTLESPDRRSRAELALVVLDPDSGIPLLEAKHTITLLDKPERAQAAKIASRPQRPPRIFKPRASQRRRGAAADPEKTEDDTTARETDSGKSEKPAKSTPSSSTSGNDRGRSVRKAKPRDVRSPRLQHVSARPEDDDVERVNELECGRMLFLDRKASERIEPISDICRWSESGEMTVEIELVCTHKKMKVKVWAEFFDAQGKGVNRTREQRHELYRGRIRGIRFESAVAAEQVVVFIERR
jgi:hypothetical protein